MEKTWPGGRREERPPRSQSRTQSPQPLWPAVGRQERCWGSRILLPQDFSGKTMQAVNYGAANQKNNSFFELCRVSTGDHPLAKKPEDSGYEIAALSGRAVLVISLSPVSSLSPPDSTCSSEKETSAEETVKVKETSLDYEHDINKSLETKALLFCYAFMFWWQKRYRSINRILDCGVGPLIWERIIVIGFATYG